MFAKDTEEGFDYIQKENETGVKKSLVELYPDKKVFDLLKKDKKLYQLTSLAAKKNGTSLKNYLSEIGFVLCSEKSSALNSFQIKEDVVRSNIQNCKAKKKYDIFLMRELTSEYGFFSSDFAKVFGISKQAITYKLKKAKKCNSSWLVDKFDDDLLSVFEQLIVKETTTEESETHFHFICTNRETKKFCFLAFPKDLTVLPMCLKDDVIPDYMIEELIKRDYHVFNSNDFLSLQDMRKATAEQNGPHGYFNNIFRRLSNKHYEYYKGTDKYEKYKQGICEGFAEIKSIPYPKDARFVSDEDIILTLQKHHSDKTGLVKIPTSSPEYQRIVNLGKSRGYYLKEFIELYGFNYEWEQEPSVAKKKRARKNLKNYIVHDNFVYLSSYDKYYKILWDMARSQEMTLTDFLSKEFGLIRIKHPRDLPIGFKPYQVQNKLEFLTKDEHYLHYIEVNLLLDSHDDTILLESGFNFYKRLHWYCKFSGLTVSEYLQKWDFISFNFTDSHKYLLDLGCKNEDALKYLEEIVSKDEARCLASDQC